MQSTTTLSMTKRHQPLAVRFKPEDLLHDGPGSGEKGQEGRPGQHSDGDSGDGGIGIAIPTEYRFTINDINVSLANAIRRVILSDIATVVFADPDINITVNTTRQNNEIIKHRLRCIPIHALTPADNLADYEVVVQVENPTTETMWVTTEHFRVRDKRTKKFIDSSRIFPPTLLGAGGASGTGGATDTGATGAFGEPCYIDVVRLRRKIADKPAEQIAFTCQFSVGTAKQDSAYNVVSLISYGNPVDPDKAEAHWRDVKLPALLLKNADLDVEFAKRDFDLLDRQRFMQPDAFKFLITSVGPYPANAIMHKALAHLVDRLDAFKTNCTADGILVPSQSSLAQGYDVLLKNDEGYTIGKIIEYELFAALYEGSAELSYVGFRKPHPHIDDCLLRLAFKDPNTTRSYVQTCLAKAADTAISKYTDLIGEFVE
jgi:hypothetical protein